MAVGDRLMETAGGVFRLGVATGDEAPEVLRLCVALAAWMIERGIHQWQPGEMPLVWLETCIAQGWVHTLRLEDELVASATVAWQDPFIWGENAEPAGYIHMLM